MQIKTVGIVGAGQMGNGIAHVFALAGYDVKMSDISQDALDDALHKIDGNLARQVSRDKITEDEKQATLSRISTTLSLPEIGPSDLIIEAATEREEIKRAIFAKLQQGAGCRRDPGIEHLVDPDHPASRRRPRPGALHGRPFLQPGAGDAG